MRFAAGSEDGRVAVILLCLVSATGLAAPSLAAQAAEPHAGLLLEAAGGVVIPLSLLGAGGRGEVRATLLPGAMPLGFSLAAGFEQHSAKSAARLSPPAGGFDVAAIDNQSLFPLQAIAHLLLVRDEHNRLQLSAGYGLLIVWSVTHLLGRVMDEKGLGHEVMGELTYARRFGSVELQLTARYSVRRTAVGAGTAAMELPWYQTVGVLAGLGVWP